MKVCILSMQRVQNFGSLLQSYALRSMLEQLGHTVAFLDIEPSDEDDQLLEGKRNRFPDEGEPGCSILSKLKKLDKYTINRLRIKWLSKCQDRKFEEFRVSVLNMENDADNSQFDCCVIGSDEVFNCLSGAPWGFTSQLFGNVKQASRVITYAASCGATVYEDVPEQVRAKIRETFCQVSAFSVRDKNTRNFVSLLTEKPVLEHLDPVVVGNFEKEIDAAQLPEKLPKRYCVVYSYYNRFHDEQDITQIKQFCSRHNMRIVTVGAPQMWIKDHLALDPFEALKVFQNAAFIITDTFHGAIFSAKYARRFAIIVRSSNENKLMDLVTRLRLRDHLVTSMNQLYEVFSREQDLKQFEEIQIYERSRSMQYLTGNL